MSMLMEHQVYVDKSSIEGRGLFALVDKPAGETLLFLPRPMAAALNIGSLDRVCSNCFGVVKHRKEHIMAKQVDNLMLCKGCKVNKFCSKVRLFLSFMYFNIQLLENQSVLKLIRS